MARILVIKHGALGDMCQAFSAFSTLRYHFPSAHLTLLTSSPYRALLQRSPWFNEILTDDRPPFTHWRHYLWIRQILHQTDWVIDLQNSSRTRSYFRLSKHKNWSGQHASARWAHTNPHCREMHTLARQNDQLRAAGLIPQPRTVPLWLLDQGLDLPSPYVVLVPGAAEHRPTKRWPLEHFISLARWLAAHNLHPVIIGDTAQRALGAKLCTAVPHTYDLTGRTSLPELATILYNAAFAIGNDTGPMHMAATMDCPGLTLFSTDSDPRRCAPCALTPHYSRTLVSNDLHALSPTRVCRYLNDWALPLLEQRQKNMHNRLVMR